MQNYKAICNGRKTNYDVITISESHVVHWHCQDLDSAVPVYTDRELKISICQWFTFI